MEWGPRHGGEDTCRGRWREENKNCCSDVCWSFLIADSSVIWYQPCSKISRSPTLETAPRKYNNAGLWQDLKTKKTEKIDPFQNGRLDDDHASSVCPNFPHAQGLTRTYVFYGTLPEPEAKDLTHDHSWKNNVGTPVFLITWNISLTLDILACLCPTGLQVCWWIQTQNWDQVEGMNNKSLLSSFFNWLLFSGN